MDFGCSKCQTFVDYWLPLAKLHLDKYLYYDIELDCYVCHVIVYTMFIAFCLRLFTCCPIYSSFYGLIIVLSESNWFETNHNDLLDISQTLQMSLDSTIYSLYHPR